MELRACAELENGQSDKALDDVKLMFRLTDSIQNEPFLISHLVRIAMTSIALQPIWEGLVKHKWSDAQLAELDHELVSLNFLNDYRFTMRNERAGAILEIDSMRRHRDYKRTEMLLGGMRGLQTKASLLLNIRCHRRFPKFCSVHSVFILCLTAGILKMS
ncbi:MAG: hypothetical protein WDM80_06705 [Limisphaerales bacterium]